MSGRAGRRGYDLVGNVIFYGVPMPKIERIIRASVPRLKGNFPTNVSFVLRLMLLAAKSEDKEGALNKV